jgi:hypothetical protein
MVMASGAAHLRWKAEHLSAVHSIENTDRLIHETAGVVATVHSSEHDR